MTAVHVDVSCSESLIYAGAMIAHLLVACSLTYNLIKEVGSLSEGTSAHELSEGAAGVTANVVSLCMACCDALISCCGESEPPVLCYPLPSAD